MKYSKNTVLKNGKTCTIRNGTEEDGKAVLDVFNLTHAQSDYLLTYPDECSFTEQGEAEFLKSKASSENEIELVAEIDGKIAGSAGIEAVGSQYKVCLRAQVGVAVAKEYWGMGIGRALMNSCVDCAKSAGYSQLELNVVADNSAAISLYKSLGFTEYGRNPRGFRSRFCGWQELVMMRLEL